MNKFDYIIDFERVNQLTTTIYDDPNDKPNYMSVRNTSQDDIEHIINTLVYNGILIDKATIRNKKIESLLEDEGLSN